MHIEKGKRTHRPSHTHAYINIHINAHTAHNKKKIKVGHISMSAEEQTHTHINTNKHTDTHWKEKKKRMKEIKKRLDTILHILNLEHRNDSNNLYPQLSQRH